MKASTERKAHLLGWIMFVCSAVFFVISSWKSGDVITLIGSLFFFFACFAFLIPMLKANPEDERGRHDVS